MNQRQLTASDESPEEGAIEVTPGIWAVKARTKDMPVRMASRVPMLDWPGHPLHGKRILRNVPAGSPDIEIVNTITEVRDEASLDIAAIDIVR